MSVAGKGGAATHRASQGACCLPEDGERTTAGVDPTKTPTRMLAGQKNSARRPTDKMHRECLQSPSTAVSLPIAVSQTCNKKNCPKERKIILRNYQRIGVDHIIDFSALLAVFLFLFFPFPNSKLTNKITTT